jgi:hypothetical protein
MKALMEGLVFMMGKKDGHRDDRLQLSSEVARLLLLKVYLGPTL